MEFSVFEEKISAGVISRFMQLSKGALLKMGGENAEEAPPYPGAKMHFPVTDLDNRQLMTRLVRAVWNALPPPKPKKAKAPKAKFHRRTGQNLCLMP